MVQLTKRQLGVLLDVAQTEFSKGGNPLDFVRELHNALRAQGVDEDTGSLLHVILGWAEARTEQAKYDDPH